MRCRRAGAALLRRMVRADRLFGKDAARAEADGRLLGRSLGDRHPRPRRLQPGLLVDVQAGPHRPSARDRRTGAPHPRRRGHPSADRSGDLHGASTCPTLPSSRCPAPATPRTSRIPTSSIAPSAPLSTASMAGRCATSKRAAPPAADDIDALDAADPLAPLRAEFELPEGVIYLDGNSLGTLTQRARERVADVAARQWGVSLIRAWNEYDWIDLPARVGGKIGTADRRRTGHASSPPTRLRSISSSSSSARLSSGRTAASSSPTPAISRPTSTSPRVSASSSVAAIG